MSLSYAKEIFSKTLDFSGIILMTYALNGSPLSEVLEFLKSLPIVLYKLKECRLKIG